MSGSPGEDYDQPGSIGILLKFSETSISLDD